MSGPVSGTPPPPSWTVALIAELNGIDVAVVEANLAGVREAYERGDRQVAEHALIEQAALLKALGLKLIRACGDTTARIQVFVGLALRAMEQERKTLATLASLRAAPPAQSTTNVQVNVGGPANELRAVASE